MKNLDKIVKSISILNHINIVDTKINSLVFDSRKVKENDCFFAINGFTSNGHHYIDKAIESGAKVIVCEELPTEIKPNIQYILVENSAIALGLMAANWFENPSEKLKLIGITGTNGKTTTTTLLFDLFTKLGYKCALLSTVENRIGSQIIPSTHTTPDPVSLQCLLHDAVEAGCDYAFMEVSSHAIHQHRIAGLHFAVAGFTNITHDHLDYHGTFIEYIKAKKQFFDNLPSTAHSITNIDDKNGLIMLQNTQSHKHNYSLKSVSEYKVKILESRMDGMLLKIQNHEFWTTLSGEFNAYNIVLVYAIADILGVSAEDSVIQLSTITKVNGRFETFKSENDIHIIVDYAHTPDALENILKSINQIRTKNETLYTIFGCGGNRDKEKRPEMARIACELSDKVIITSDNPRNEEPSEIISEIEKGIPPQYYNKTISIADRKEAIKNALIQAKNHDIILIAGKGHENYQEIKGVKHPFDDKEIAKEILIKLKIEKI